jgi:Repeat of unknown function (DUF5648)/Matrixin
VKRRAFRECWLVLIVALGLAATGPADAFVLGNPPASRFAMNLNLLPDTPFASIGYGVTTWNLLAESALAEWNAVGIGAGRDTQFFTIRVPTVTATDPCGAPDAINTVTFLSSLCGTTWGDVLGVTLEMIRQSDGRVTEVSVLFNGQLAFNAYRGPVRPAPDFYRVVLHEFGHVVGLDHPDQNGQNVTALMNSRESNLDDLQADDIAGAHSVDWAGAPTLPPSSRVAISTATPSTATIPLYRFFNVLTGTHFYTANESERLSIIQNLPAYAFEGVAYNVPSNTGPGTVPVFRFFNTSTGTHFYTTSPAERDHIIAALPGFRFEGTAFQAYTSDAGLLPVYRFFDTATGTHFYTASQAERDQILATLPSYRLEGIAYFVGP